MPHLLDPTDPATRAAFPALARIYDTLKQCFQEEPPGTLAANCATAINAVPMPAADRAAILSLCMAYGRWGGSQSPAATICQDVLYEVWADLRTTYGLPPVPEAEQPSAQSWPGRVYLLHLIAEQARLIVRTATKSRLSILTEDDTADFEGALDQLFVDWGTPPTVEEIEAWRNTPTEEV